MKNKLSIMEGNLKGVKKDMVHKIFKNRDISVIKI